jgi:hypothetical protein
MKKLIATNVFAEKEVLTMFRFLLTSVLVLTCSIRAYGIGFDHPADRVYLRKTPAGLNTLLNQTNRVHGFTVNVAQRFFFAGDTPAFSAFLKQYAALKGIAGHRLIIHTGKGFAKSPWDDDEGKPCDWMLDVAPTSWRERHSGKVYRDKDGTPPKEGEKEYVVELHVWTKGNVDIKKVEIPKGVTVAHKKEKQSEKPKSPNK